MKEQEFIKYCHQLNQLICDAMDQFISGCNEEISEEDVSGVIQAVLSETHLSHFAFYFFEDTNDIDSYMEFLKKELEQKCLVPMTILSKEIVGRA